MKTKIIIFLVSISTLAAFVAITLAEVMSGGVYVIDKDVISSGDSIISGGTYEIIQTIGQPPGFDTISGGAYQLEAGYLHPNIVPSAPSCVSPINNAEVSNDTPTLQWSAFSDPDDDSAQSGWEIQIDTEDDWDGTYVQTPSGSDANTQFTLTTPLPAADIYYWRVRVKDDNGAWSNWSASASFRQLHVYVDDSAAPAGNGTSTSKYQTINDAIDIKVTSNYTYSVHVAAGTYSEQVDLDGKNAKLYGAGQGSSIVDGGGARSYCIYIHSSATTSASLVDGFTFQNALYDGAHITSGTGIQFTNCTFTSNGRYGIYVVSSTTSATFTDCTISNNCTVTNSAGVMVSDGPPVVFDNCEVYGNYYYGFQMYYGDWTIKNCYIHDGPYAGIYCAYRDSNRPGVIKDNIICKNRYYNVMLYHHNNTLIWNNVMGGSGDSNHECIYTYQSAEAQIVGNKIVGQYGEAFYGHSGDHSLLVNNTMYANNYIAISWDYESRPTVYNNIIAGNNSWGVYKGAYVLNDDEDIQYNNVWNNSSGTYSSFCQHSNGISSDPLFTVSASGTSTSLTISTLTDTAKSWTTNEWKGYILIPNTGNRRRAFIIVSNTSTTLTVGSYDPAYEITDYATVGNSYEITDLTLQGGSPCINTGHTADRFSDTYGAYNRNDIGATGGYGPIPRSVPYNISACINNTGVSLNSTYYQLHPDKSATFSWAQTGGTSVVLSSNTDKNPTFTAPATNQTLTFTVTVNDGYADSAAHTCYAYINPYVQINGAGSYTSINNAVDNATTGQIVNVPAGRFMETVDTDGKAITVDGADNFASIIDGDDRISYAVYMHNNETSATVIKDLEIKSTYRHSIYIYDDVATDNTTPTIQNNYIHDCYSAMRTYRSHPIVTGNYFVRNLEDYPVYIDYQSAGTYKKNHISGNRSYMFIYNRDLNYTTTFENNIVAAGISYGFYVYNPNSNANFINNAIYANQSYGIRIRPDAVATVKNNIVASNHSYGIYLESGGTLYNTYNDVWNNSSANYSGCSAGTGDISLDPALVIEDTGTSTGITYTTLTDTSKSWATDQWRGYYLVADINDKLVAFIWSNTADTLSVMNMRNIDWSADAGNTYRIISFKLQKPSPCIDVGTNTGAPADDFWGDTRPYDNGFAYYDNVADMGVDETAYSLPGKPTIGVPEALSSTSVRWYFTDTADDELGFRLHDASHNVMATVSTPNLTYIDEEGLSANTQYSRHVVSYNETVIPNSPNANGDSDDSGTASRVSLSADADVVEDNGRETSAPSDQHWYRAGNFVFSSAGLNSNTIEYYRYVWDRLPSTEISGGETQWLTATQSLAGSNSKQIYLHVLSYNSENVAVTQGTQHYGPYYYVETPRLLRHGKFFDDDGNLIELGPKEE